MRLRIDVQDKDGVTLGPGPIDSASNWRSTARLDRVGDFSFEMPAADPRAALLVNRRRVAAKMMVGGVMTWIGAGIIEHLDTRGGPGPTTLVVSGPDLLRELTWRSVGQLTLAQAGLVPPENVHILKIDHTSGLYLNEYTETPEWFDSTSSWRATTMDVDHRIYIGFSHPFNALDFTLQAANTVTDSWNIQYYTASAAGWVGISGYVDGTAVSGKTLAQAGTMSWTMPSDWAPLDQECLISGVQRNHTCYWIRMQPQFINLLASLIEITVHALVPTTATLAPLIALAPSGWSLDTVLGYSTSAATVFLELAGENVLAAFSNLAQLTGEHFRLGTGRKLAWLRTTTPASGIRAIRGGNPYTASGDGGNLAVAQILDLQKADDSFELVSRIIPYGAGNGTARVTLAQTTRTAPSGYTLNAAANYLKNDAAETAYGQVESPQSFPHLGPATTAVVDQINAANTLFDQALAWLSTRTAVATSYRLSVVGLGAQLLPGTTIWIIWKEIIDGYTVLDVNSAHIILEATTALDATGGIVTSLLVSPTAIWPASDLETMVATVRKLVAAQAHPQLHDSTALATPTAKSGQTAIGTGSGGLVFAGTPSVL